MILRIVLCTLTALAALTSVAQPTAERVPPIAERVPPIAERVSPIAVSFEEFWAAARDRPFPDQEQAWDRYIERPRRGLYASVVWEAAHHPHWREDRERQLKRRFAEYSRVNREVSSAAQALASRIPAAIARFRALFPDAPAHPPIRLLLAPNFDAKSGVLRPGVPVLVFAVDSLVLEGADMSLLFPHELFHLYHALRAGIENDGVMPGADLTLPLFAEGLATYVSSLLAPGHSDGKLLLQDSLGDVSPSRVADVAARFLADADAPAIDPAHPLPYARWFMASSHDYQLDLPNRAGYWLGLWVIRHMRERSSLQVMVSWTPVTAQRETRMALRELARVE
jgi:hypothetical protein